MRGGARALALSLAFVVLGAVVLRGFAARDATDPTMSTTNPGPRGALALARFLAALEVPLAVRARHDAPLPSAGVLIVPPPERAGWSHDEVSALSTLVASGGRVIVLCDDDDARNGRLVALADDAHVRCALDETVDASTLTAGVVAGALERSVGAAVTLDEDATAVALAEDGDARVVVEVPRGAGAYVFAPASLFANDGLARADHAAFLAALVGDGPVTVDDAHHGLRRAEVLTAAFGHAGPRVGLLALLLLVPAAFLRFFPRPGDPVLATTSLEPEAARHAASGLAALYRQAGVVFDDDGRGSPPEASRDPLPR